MLYEQTSMTARLISIRKDMKLTQAQFADRLNVPRSTYKNYENGREPSARCLRTLVVQEGIDARWLISGRTKVLKVDDDQLVKDCMTLRSAIDNRIHSKGIHLTDDQKSNIIMLLVQKRSEGFETDFYDRDYMCQLIRGFASNAEQVIDEAAE